MRNLIIFQFGTTVIVALLFSMQGFAIALSAIYGGSIALINSLVSVRRINRVTARHDDSVAADVRSIYAGAVQRLAFTVLAMAFAMGPLQLDPLSLLVCFGCSQIGFLFSAPFRSSVAKA